MDQPIIGETYQHFRNKKYYTIIGIARDTMTEGDVVVYQAQYDDPKLGKKPLFVRPVDNFMDQVEHDGSMVHRFTRTQT